MIVETARGVEFGTVVTGQRDVEDDKITQPLKPVIRIATQDDIRKEEKNREKEKEAFGICLEKIRKHGLEMKLIDAEYTLSLIHICYRNEAAQLEAYGEGHSRTVPDTGSGGGAS